MRSRTSSVSSPHSTSLRAVILFQRVALIIGLFSVPALRTNALAQTDNLRASLTSYYDTTHGTPHVIYQAANGSLVDLYYSSGWQSAVLTDPNTQGVFGVSTVGFYDGTYGHVFGVCPGVNTQVMTICELYGQTTPNNFGNPSGTSPQGSVTGYYSGSNNYAGPLFGSTISGFWDGSCEHVFYLSTDNSVHEHYYCSGNWYDHSIGGGSVGVEPGSDGLELTSAWNGMEHVFYIGQDLNLHELYYANGIWGDTNWSNNCGLPSPNFVAYSIQTVPTSSIPTYGANSGFDGKMAMCYESSGSWMSGVNTEPDFMTSPADTPSPMTSLVVQYGHTYAYAYYVGSDGNNIYQLFDTVEPQAMFPSGAPSLAKSDEGFWAPITALWDGTYQHVFYIASNRHVIDLRTCPNPCTSFSYFDLSQYVSPFYPAAL
jgi:hypothetical protein